jgi:hypothetical protein
VLDFPLISKGRTNGRAGSIESEDDHRQSDDDCEKPESNSCQSIQHHQESKIYFGESGRYKEKSVGAQRDFEEPKVDTGGAEEVAGAMGGYSLFSPA